MKVSIIGAGGHTRTLINLLELNQIEVEGVYDDNFDPNQTELIESIPLKGTYKDVPKGEPAIISKGDTKDLIALSERFKDQIFQSNIIHPKAVIDSNNLGSANQISALTYVAKSAKIGNQNIIYSNSSIEHESEIGNNNILTVNVTICGRVKVGNNCYFGASSTVLPYIKIVNNTIIGAGAVVTKDILEAGTYVGVPAKRIK